MFCAAGALWGSRGALAGLCPPCPVLKPLWASQGWAQPLLLPFPALKCRGNGRGRVTAGLEARPDPAVFWGSSQKGFAPGNPSCDSGQLAMEQRCLSAADSHPHVGDAVPCSLLRSLEHPRCSGKGLGQSRAQQSGCKAAENPKYPFGARPGAASGPGTAPAPGREGQREFLLTQTPN